MQAPSTCAWCGAPLTDATAVPGGLACARCGVITTSPWPDDAELAAAYADAYRPDSGRFSGPGDALLRRLRGRLATRLDDIAPPGPVLDVGAGEGTLLRALQARGRTAVGLERDATAPGMRAAEVTELDPAQEQFAAIVFWHSLEHLREPGTALDHAVRLLAPGGTIVVAVPNAASLQARVFGEDWLALDPPRHLTHIPARSLTTRLAEGGLAIERVSHWRGGQVAFGWLHGLVARTTGGDLYDAIRRPEARMSPLTAGGRARALGMGVVLSPIAAMAGVTEVALRRGGSVYVEARAPVGGP
jgi:SAM-dependent methyltransferase